MVRVLIIVICAVCDIWLLHQIWIAERSLRNASEKLLWTIFTLVFHVVAVAVYIFLDTTGNKNSNQDDSNTTIYM